MAGKTIKLFLGTVCVLDYKKFCLNLISGVMFSYGIFKILLSVVIRLGLTFICFKERSV